MSKKYEFEKIEALYVQGQSLREIAREVEVSASTVKRILLANGIELRDKNQADKAKNSWWQNYEYLSEAYIQQSKSTSIIGREVNASSRTVHAWITKLNIPTRPVGGEYKKGTTMSVGSRRKMSAAKKGKYTGSNNPNWKGAQISEAVRQRRSYDAKMWRTACLKRDDFKCTMCGSTQKLHVHHILEFADHPDRRWDINNGKTLCVFCHEKVHKRIFPNWLTERKRVENSAPVFAVKQDHRPFTIEPSILRWLYDSNSIAKISEMFGSSDEAVRKKLDIYGIKRRRVGGVKASMPSKEKLQSVYPRLNLENTAKHFKVGQTLVHKWLKMYDIPTTKKRRNTSEM